MICDYVDVRPLDPRLLKYARRTRPLLAVMWLVSLLETVAVVARIMSMSLLLALAVHDGMDLKQLLTRHWLLTIFLLSLGLLPILRFVQAALGNRAAGTTIEELRSQVLAAVSHRSYRWQKSNSVEVATLATAGLSKLNPYFVEFLPQLFLSFTATPIALLLLAVVDIWSAIIAVLAIPLIPIFMILVGKLTLAYSNRKMAALQQLSSQLLDLFSGLPTMRGLGRTSAPQKSLDNIGRSYASTTMQTLRVAFLSGAILEFITTLSVALVAVEVGLRLVAGNISLSAGLMAIMLAPEVFNPIRAVGTKFHASSDGVAAFEQAFEIIERGSTREKEIVNLEGELHWKLRMRNVSVLSRGDARPHDLSLDLTPGTITALTGPSGAGKSTALMAALGRQQIDEGEVLLEMSDSRTFGVGPQGTDLVSNTTWIPQDPFIFPGSLRENLAFGQPITTTRLREALALSGLDEVVASLPKGLDSPVGLDGAGLSLGQRQRVAIARAILHRRSLIFMDEPTAHLDPISEETIINVIRWLADRGSAVVVISHRTATADAADQKIEVKFTVCAGEAEPEKQREAEVEEMRSFFDE